MLMLMSFLRSLLHPKVHGELVASQPIHILSLNYDYYLSKKHAQAPPTIIWKGWLEKIGGDALVKMTNVLEHLCVALVV